MRAFAAVHASGGKLDAAWRSALLALALPGLSEAGVPSIEEARLESPHYVLAFRTEAVPVSRHLALHFSAEERAKVLLHGPWPPPLARDPSNRVSGVPEAIALGEKLFFEPRLSGPGSVLCATCHAPFRAFQDGRRRGFGLQPAERNTQSLIDARFYRRFGWDGAQDSLWAQSLRPLLDPREMGAGAAHVAGVIRKSFDAPYRKAFGRAVPQDDEEVLVDAAKALAAFQETLVSGRTAFDEFRDALARNDAERMKAYPLAAQRGLRIFIGKGRCSVCHFGPQFTHGELAGREKLKGSPFNLGRRHVKPRHRNSGEWRVPGLRGVAETAPYMHDGSLATLRDVVTFYSELHEERLHARGGKMLRPLKLGQEEADDLLAFLESLTDLKAARVRNSAAAAPSASRQ